MIGRQHFTLFIILCAFSTLFTACYSSRYAHIDLQMEKAREAIHKEDSTIGDLLDLNSEKLNRQSIDSFTSTRIDEKLGNFSERLDELKSVANVYDSIMNDKQAFRKSYRNILISGVPLLVERVNEPKSKELRYVMYDMIWDLLNRSKQNLFPMAAFFGPGEYRIPPGNQGLVTQQFSPLLDSMALFANKYAAIEREAVVSFYGYADEINIDPHSELGQMLIRVGGLSSGALKSEMNEVLSALRARAMYGSFRYLYQSKMDNFQNPANLILVNVVQGMGESFPNPNITDYRPEDERRRIVLFYWAILPK